MFVVESKKHRRTCSLPSCKKVWPECLRTCERCHAVNYCDEKCQGDDWDRHSRNCPVPAMEKEIREKGRGIVAARDIKMGEVIFTDISYIDLPLNEKGELNIQSPAIMKSLKEQIKNLSSEAKSNYLKLSTAAKTNLINFFLENYSTMENRAMLFLNLALVNHSCVPNAEAGKIGLYKELRAIKDISKGKEITIFYGFVADYNGRFFKKNYMNYMKKILGFDCKCLM